MSNASTIQPESPPRLLTVALVLVCVAICVAALAAGIDKAFAGIGLLSANGTAQTAAGVPGDKLYTSVVCLCSLLAAALAAIHAARSQANDTETAALPVSHRIVVWALFALPLVSLASLVTRWLMIDHGSVTYLDAMMRGLTYWSSLSSLALTAYYLGRRMEKAFQAMLIALIAASTIASVIAVQDYLVSVFARHLAGWREFGTSTPDFFAAFLLVTMPVCFGAFLASTQRDSTLAYGFCAALQFAAIPTTGSRFALISLVVELAIFALSYAALYRRDRSALHDTRGKLLDVVAVIVVGGVVFAGPVIHRLQAASLRSDANSGAFRVYTWRGALRLARAYPVFGTGPDLFQYDFPRYALAGFTRLAHSGYLQSLDELGALATLAFSLISIGCIVVVGRTILSRQPDASVLPGLADSKVGLSADTTGVQTLVLIGLMSGVVGMAVQNLIDSDWMVTICGATWFAAVGLLLAGAYRGQMEAGEIIPSSAAARSMSALCWGASLVALSLCVCSVKWCAGGWLERQGQLGSASAAVPLDGEYAGSAGYALAQDSAEFPAALALLKNAAQLTPSATAFRRLAEIQSAMGDLQAALGDVGSGLRVDPNDLSLLLLGAQISTRMNDGAGTLNYYRKVAALQIAPYGTVPAIGDLTEYRYAYADEALEADALNRGDAAAAIIFGTRAKIVFDQYLVEGGSSNPARISMSGPPNGQMDAQLQSLYGQCMTLLASAYARNGQLNQASAVHAEAARKLPKFISKAPSVQH